MDVMTDWLQRVVQGGVTLARSHIAAPWGVQMVAAPGVTFHLLARGDGWLRDGINPPLPLAQGDLVVVTDGRAHDLVDDPASPAEPPERFAHRAPPPAGGEHAIFYCGHFAPDSRAAINPLPALPGIMHFRAADLAEDQALGTIVGLLGREVERPGPGSALLVRQLADSLLVYVLRVAARRFGHGTGWFAAMHDPYLARAFAAVHADPRADWTVERLAAAAGLSRAAFARRFADHVGQPPLAYLTSWRMTLAARMLEAGRTSMAVISDQVGYQSEAAFSRAFKRHFGVAPARYRRAG